MFYGFFLLDKLTTAGGVVIIHLQEENVLDFRESGKHETYSSHM